MPKRYIYVTPFFPSAMSWRGAYCLDFVKAMKRLGKYDVSVFVPGSGEDYEIDGVTVHTFPVKVLPSNVFPFLYSGYNRRSFLNALQRNGIDVKEIAVCHANTATFGIYPLAVKMLNPGCLTLLHHHDLQPFGLNNGVLCHFWPYNVIQFPLLRRIHDQIDCHVFISRKAEESLRCAPDAGWTDFAYYRKQMRGLGFYRPAKIKRSLILHNGVDTSIFGRKQTVQDGSCFTIGCIGNFLELKGQIDLLAAMKVIGREIGDWKVKFVGSGKMLPDCRRFAVENGFADKVEFLSEVKHEMLADFYRELDLFVLPSWFEGFGCVFLESWSCGVPFITCKGQGIEDMIPAGDCEKWLCNPRDPDDVAEKILSYYRSRYQQNLTVSANIDDMVAEFVKDIDLIRGGK